ncbi:pyridoxal phosphate-dependent aminotransferase [Rivibacter subsaxonicus]|uniref:Aspartate/methionine/tyrosine aminotransferase n=1 Tax=Rivibacter subsaxonicus TaxID=457575 RepID=A0A4Q7VNP3_9BURK|nr:pyridoxal phosphate-dependent aminotransferase [Rivibacter subsaxonicus]RZT97942.1 aspartate/methionine/tyrosine aminotransferase [Rivibacter subsaxonicus]
MKLANRLSSIEPFYVMECAKAAQRIAASPACDPARGGEPMIYLNIGEPDFGAPSAVLEAAHDCLAQGRTQYTQATGLPALRRAISGWYASRFGLAVDPDRIIVTAGASAALQLACLALFERGDQVLMPDPSYPCNRHFVAAADAEPVLLACGPQQRFQPSAAQIEAAWTPQTRGVLLASPSNPTGTSIERAEMGRIVEAARARGGVTLVDEIYLGLSFDEAFGHSALEHGEDVVSINSFSKYFCMTGWRLGWLVVPPALVAPIERLAQNLFICASSLAQQAALACFTPAAITEAEARRAAFRARRDFVVPELEKLGLRVPVMPDGAFYAWVDASAHLRPGQTSWELAFELMDSAHVALTPGRDFGPAIAASHLRLSYASSLDQLEQAIARLARVLAARR